MYVQPLKKNDQKRRPKIQPKVVDTAVPISLLQAWYARFSVACSGLYNPQYLSVGPLQTYSASFSLWLQSTWNDNSWHQDKRVDVTVGPRLHNSAFNSAALLNDVTWRDVTWYRRCLFAVDLKTTLVRKGSLVWKPLKSDSALSG